MLFTFFCEGTLFFGAIYLMFEFEKIIFVPTDIKEYGRVGESSYFCRITYKVYNEDLVKSRGSVQLMLDFVIRYDDRWRLEENSHVWVFTDNDGVTKTPDSPCCCGLALAPVLGINPASIAPELYDEPFNCENEFEDGPTWSQVTNFIEKMSNIEYEQMCDRMERKGIEPPRTKSIGLNKEN